MNKTNEFIPMLLLKFDSTKQLRQSDRSWTETYFVSILCYFLVFIFTNVDFCSFFFTILKVLFFILQPAPTQPKRYPFVTKRILLTRDPKDKSIKGQWLNNKSPIWNRKRWAISDSFCSNFFWNVLDYTILEHFKNVFILLQIFSMHPSLSIYLIS